MKVPQYFTTWPRAEHRDAEEHGFGYGGLRPLLPIRRRATSLLEMARQSSFLVNNGSHAGCRISSMPSFI